MDSNEFSRQIYEFLQENEASGHLTNVPAEDAIAEINDFLADPALVAETIRDIEEIADSFDDHQYYVSEVRPLVEGLQRIHKKLEAEQNRRMVSDTGYEVKQSFRVGTQEIIFAENKNAADGMCYFVGNYTENELLGQYANCIASDDYLEAVLDFSDRVSGQVEATKAEIAKIGLPTELFTAEHCYPNDYKQSIGGKIVALKADIFRPEYRRGDVQLILVDGGNGARANPSGRTIFCYHLNDGQRSRFYRQDVQGEVKPECLPLWAKEKADTIMAEQAISRQKKTRKMER